MWSVSSFSQFSRYLLLYTTVDKNTSAVTYFIQRHAFLQILQKRKKLFFSVICILNWSIHNYSAFIWNQKPTIRTRKAIYAMSDVSVLCPVVKRIVLIFTCRIVFQIAIYDNCFQLFCLPNVVKVEVFPWMTQFEIYILFREIGIKFQKISLYLLVPKHENSFFLY